jgi:hypothetical protein
MPQYRFYNLEKEGQAVVARIDLTLDDDAAAIACAEQLIVGEEIQVWQGSRRRLSRRLAARVGFLHFKMREHFRCNEASPVRADRVQGRER